MKKLCSGLIIASVLLGYCATISPDDAMNQSILTYNDNMRWKKYEEASLFVPPTLRESFVKKNERRGDKIKIVSYEIGSLIKKKKKDEIQVSVWIRYYRYDDLIVQRKKVTQTWKLAKGDWLLISEVSND